MKEDRPLARPSKARRGLRCEYEVPRIVAVEVWYPSENRSNRKRDILVTKRVVSIQREGKETSHEILSRTLGEREGSVWRREAVARLETKRYDSKSVWPA